MREVGDRPLRSHSGRSVWRCCWWWRSTGGGSSRDTMRGDNRLTHRQHGAGHMTEKHYYLLAVLPALRLQRHHSDRARKQYLVQFILYKWHFIPCKILLIEKCKKHEPSHFLPSKEVTWKQKRRSSQSTAMTEQLSRSVTSPPATSPRPWCIRLPPCVKKYWRSHDDETSPVLLRDTQKSYFKSSSPSTSRKTYRQQFNALEL